MTALCGGGVSGVQPGVSGTALLASGFAAVALDLYGAGWMKWALPFLSLPELALTTFCGTDPPAIPTFTTAEATALMNVTLGSDFSSGLSKFGDLIQHLAWYQFCQCNTGALVALPAAPVPALTVPVWVPPPVEVTASPCHILLAAGAPFILNPTVLNSALNTCADPSPTSVRLKLNPYTNGGGPHGTQTAQVDFLAPGRGIIATSGPIPAPMDLLTTYDLDLPAGVNLCRTTITPSVFPCSDGFDHNADFFYGTRPNYPVGNCLPDPRLQEQVDQLLRLVTLLQRQLVPFAYVTPASHPGLSGSGTITVQGLLGVQINLTTIPAGLKQDASVPPFVFNAGWVSIEDANGFIDETRAHSATQTWMPRIASEATKIGYSFTPGVVATINEIAREP